MYEWLPLFAGMITSIMVMINGHLSGAYGVWAGVVLIHIAGCIFSFILTGLLKFERFPRQRLPLWIYTGGVIGVASTVLQNASYRYFGMTALISLTLLGQTLTSLCIDVFGLFGIRKKPFRVSTAVCLFLSLCGMWYMMRGTSGYAPWPVCMCLICGFTLVTSRMVNGRLSQQIHPLSASFVNHLTGLVVTILLYLFMCKPGTILLHRPIPALWTFTGGCFGVVVVLLYNLCVLKVSSVRVTLLAFIGQILSGFVLDVILGNTYAVQTLVGTAFITGGVLLHTVMEERGAHCS